MYSLMDTRYQRQEALSIMRHVNEAYKLSNPPSWYGKTIVAVGKAVTWLKTLLPPKQAPTRVCQSRW